MNKLSTPKFEIIRSSRDYSDDGIRYFYRIDFTEEIPRHGVVDLMINRVRAYRDDYAVYDSNTLRFHELIETDLEESDFVAFLRKFFPHGEYKSAKEVVEHTGKGVGSAVLEKLINDSVEHDAKMMYVFTNSDSLPGFLVGKHDFNPFRSEGKPIQAVNRWYKML